MPGPCTGLTVLDFSQGMPGAIASLVLADYGADVIKVEPPGGDPFRFQPGWLAWNRGKQGIVLDLSTSEGRAQAAALASKADVILESFLPGDMTKMGLDYETLAKSNPGLIYCSITGFGQKGPLARVPGYEGVVNARAGRMLNLEGQPRRRGPVYSAVYTGSWHASQSAVRGILAALRVRDISGQGQWVQTSIVQSLAAPHDFNAGPGGLMARQLTKMDPARYPPNTGDPSQRGQSSVGYIPVRTKDGKWLQHGNLRDPHVEGHMRLIGLGDLIDNDPRFKKPASVQGANREELRRHILQAQLQKTGDEWMELYVKDGNIAAEIYRTTTEGMRHEQFAGSNSHHTVEDPRVGPMLQLGLLSDLKHTPGQPGGPAPDVGQHTTEVLDRLGKAPARTVTTSGPTPRHPLEGVMILDLATVQAGPYGCTLLAELGARVIKVDATDDRVDEGRRSNAREIADPRTYAGKEGLQVNLQTPEGKEILHRLIARADVLLHNFRVGVDKRLEVDWETCHAINPRLVHVWMGTYGEKGRHANRPGAHPIPGAVMGGPMRQMGRGMPPPPDAELTMEETIEATRSIMRSNWGPDQNTSSAIATGVMLGLRARDLTGIGQPVHTTMIMANAWTNADEAFDYQGRPPIEVPDPDIRGLHALYRLYNASDGWVFLGALFQDEWEAFSRSVRREDLLSDARFATREARIANDEALIEELAGVFATKTAAEWESQLTAVGVACVIADAAVEGDFYADDPHAIANELTVEVDHPVMGKYLRYGGLVHFSLTPGIYESSIQIGQHTRPILREIGFSEAEIEDFGARGVVQWANLPEATAS